MMRLIAFLLLALSALVPGPGGEPPIRFARELSPVIPLFFIALRFLVLRRRDNRDDAWTALVLYCALYGSTVVGLAFSVKTEITGLRDMVRFFHYSGAFLIGWCTYRAWKREALYLLGMGLCMSFPFLWGSVWNPLGALPPVALYMLYLAGDRPSKPSAPAVWLLVLPVSVFVLLVPDPTKGMPYLLRLIALFGCLDIASRVSFASARLSWTLRLLLALNLIWLAIGAGFQIANGVELLAKKSSLAGVNSNDAGGVVALAAVILIARRPRIRWLRYIDALLFLFAAAILVFLQARIPVASLIVGLFLLWLLRARASPTDPVRNRRFKVIGAAALFLAVFVFAGLVAFVFDPLEIYATLFERFLLWNQGIAYLESHPMGAGPGHHLSLIQTPPDAHGSIGHIRLQQSYLKNGADLHTHNLMLQSWLDFGPVAFLALLLVLSVVAAGLIAARQKVSIALAPPLITLLVQGFFNNHLINPTYVFFFAVFLGSTMRLLPLRSTLFEPRSWRAVGSVGIGLVMILVFYLSIAVSLRQMAMMPIAEHLYLNRTHAFEVLLPCEARFPDPCKPTEATLMIEKEGEEWIPALMKARERLRQSALLLPRDEELAFLQAEVSLWLAMLRNDQGGMREALALYERSARSEYNPMPAIRRLMMWHAMNDQSKLASSYLQKLRARDHFELFATPFEKSL